MRLSWKVLSPTQKRIAFFHISLFHFILFYFLSVRETRETMLNCEIEIRNCVRLIVLGHFFLGRTENFSAPSCKKNFLKIIKYWQILYWQIFKGKKKKIYNIKIRNRWLEYF